LTTAEINRILRYLEQKDRDELQSFAYDYFANINMLSEVPEDTVNNFIESMRFFWFPYQLEVSYKTVLVRNYIVYSMPSSGRCFFLNPIDRKCFIYPARLSFWQRMKGWKGGTQNERRKERIPDVLPSFLKPTLPSFAYKYRRTNRSIDRAVAHMHDLQSFARNLWVAFL
jgi:hypothetical protein